jgi:hypothetical protein
MTTQQLWEYRRPLRHFRGTGVLPPDRYEVTASKFREILARTSDFRRSQFENYDAQIKSIGNDLAGCFPDLFSATAIRFLHRVVAIPFPAQGCCSGLLESPPVGWLPLLSRPTIRELESTVCENIRRATLALL